MNLLVLWYRYIADTYSFILKNSKEIQFLHGIGCITDVKMRIVNILRKILVKQSGVIYQRAGEGRTLQKLIISFGNRHKKAKC